MRILIALLCLLLAAPVFGQDAIDLGSCQYHNSPNVSSWPITSDFQSLAFMGGEIRFRHSKSGQWPPVPFETTTQEATIWLAVNINGRWHCAGAERVRPGQTAKQLTTPYDMIVGWLYDSNRWQEMTSHQLQPGETVAMWITSGDMRSQMAGGPRERTAAKLVTLPVSGITASYPPWGTASQPSQPSQPHQPEGGLSSEQWTWIVTTLTQIAEQQRIQREAIVDLTTWAQGFATAVQTAQKDHADQMVTEFADLRLRMQQPPPGVTKPDWVDYVVMGLLGVIGVQQGQGASK